MADANVFVSVAARRVRVRRSDEVGFSPQIAGDAARAAAAVLVADWRGLPLDGEAARVACRRDIDDVIAELGRFRASL